MTQLFSSIFYNYLKCKKNFKHFLYFILIATKVNLQLQNELVRTRAFSRDKFSHHLSGRFSLNRSRRVNTIIPTRIVRKLLKVCLFKKRRGWSPAPTGFEMYFGCAFTVWTLAEADGQIARQISSSSQCASLFHIWLCGAATHTTKRCTQSERFNVRNKSLSTNTCFKLPHVTLISRTLTRGCFYINVPLNHCEQNFHFISFWIRFCLYCRRGHYFNFKYYSNFNESRLKLRYIFN